ncbi:MAG: hypothetical protein LBM25_03225 [Bacteroidales bacterium]|jgi:gliding motility-associated lipoprotein GldD|nr:hypothetical protein [Bacteroidales bacterium]
MQKINYFILLSILIGIFLVSCSNDTPIPKPKTYFRMSVPEPEYEKFDTLNMPFTFMYPNYGVIERDNRKFKHDNWFNINFPQYGCKLYFSLMQINSKLTLDTLINDSYNFTTEHRNFSNGIREKEFTNEKERIFANVFEIIGEKVASPYQFFITDSTKYFLRGALYMEFKANNDSLAPVLDRVKEDINNIISTFAWKKD